MPEYQVSIELVDDYSRRSVKRYETVATMVDHPTAVVAAADLAADLAALSEMDILAYTVGLRTTFADTVTVGANKDEGITLVLRKEDNRNGILRIPAPMNSVLNPDGTVDTTDALVTDYTANFITAGNFTFSDGEQASVLLSGRLDK